MKQASGDTERRQGDTGHMATRTWEPASQSRSVSPSSPLQLQAPLCGTHVRSGPGTERHCFP